MTDLFWSKVDQSAGDDGCWLWGGSVGSHGYGDLRREGRHFLAHRYSLGLTEELLPGSWVLHSCDNRLCVNPAHLRQGGHAENMQDMAARGRSLRGVRSWFAKLTEADVLDIRARVAAGEKQYQVAADLGLHKNTVHYIVQRRTWKHV